MGFLIGLLLGALAALLYTPKRGDEMRDEMRTRTDELRRRADNLQRSAQRIAGEAQTKSRELIDDAKQEWKASDKTGGPGSGPAAGAGRSGGPA